MAVVPTLRVLPTYLVNHLKGRNSVRSYLSFWQGRHPNLEHKRYPLFQSCRFHLNYSIIATDMKSGVPNDSTHPTTDPPSQECISAKMNQVADLEIRISSLKSGGDSTLQTPMAVTNNNNSIQQDDKTKPLKCPSGSTQDPLSSNPTSSFRQKYLTARIFIRIACLYILVIILLQTFYAHYTNLRASHFWWNAAYDWCFATEACNTKVGTPLKESFDVVLSSISAFRGMVEMTCFHCLGIITSWLPLIVFALGVEHIFLFSYLIWFTLSFWRSTNIGK